VLLGSLWILSKAKRWPYIPERQNIVLAIFNGITHFYDSKPKTVLAQRNISVVTEKEVARRG
jgi:hypothetical protein